MNHNNIIIYLTLSASVALLTSCKISREAESFSLSRLSASTIAAHQQLSVNNLLCLLDIQDTIFGDTGASAKPTIRHGHLKITATSQTSTNTQDTTCSSSTSQNIEVKQRKAQCAADFNPNHILGFLVLIFLSFTMLIVLLHHFKVID